MNIALSFRVALQYMPFLLVVKIVLKEASLLIKVILSQVMYIISQFVIHYHYIYVFSYLVQTNLVVAMQP